MVMAESFPTTRLRTSTSKQQALKSMSQLTKDRLSVLLSTSDVYEIVEHVATEMTSGLVVSDFDVASSSSSNGGSSVKDNNFGPQLDSLDNTFIMPINKDMVNGGGDICELAVELAIQVTDGLQLAPVNSPVALALEQGGGHHDNHDENLIINIDPINDEPPTKVVSSVRLSQAMMRMSLLTMVITVGTALYKPARGALFSHHKLAYYLTLVGIFAAGVAEALTAVWLSHSHKVDERCFSFGRAVLCASLVPFVAIIGIGGFAFMEG